VKAGHSEKMKKHLMIMISNDKIATIAIKHKTFELDKPGG